MKIFYVALTILVLMSNGAFAQSSPTHRHGPGRAAKKHVFGMVDNMFAVAVVAARTLDFTSTEECVRRPWQQCHEAELPNALVENKAAFIIFEGGLSALSIWSQYELTKHQHRRLALLSQSIDAALLSHTVEKNYRLDATLIHAHLTSPRSPSTARRRATSGLRRVDVYRADNASASSSILGR